MYSARRNADPTSQLIELTVKRNYKKEKIEEYIMLHLYFSFFLF